MVGCAVGAPPYFIVIDRALRDEGTSYHYLPPSEYAEADPRLLAFVSGALAALTVPVYQGATWTTDAPFRETEAVIADRCARGILAVEMEAAALYALTDALRVLAAAAAAWAASGSDHSPDPADGAGEEDEGREKADG